MAALFVITKPQNHTKPHGDPAGQPSWMYCTLHCGIDDEGWCPGGARDGRVAWREIGAGPVWDRAGPPSQPLSDGKMNSGQSQETPMMSWPGFIPPSQGAGRRGEIRPSSIAPHGSSRTPVLESQRPVPGEVL